MSSTRRARRCSTSRATTCSTSARRFSTATRAYLARMLDGLRGEGVAPPLVLWALDRRDTRRSAACSRPRPPADLRRTLARGQGLGRIAPGRNAAEHAALYARAGRVGHRARRKGGSHGEGARARRCVGRAAPARVAVRERSARQARGAPQRRPCLGKAACTAVGAVLRSLNCPLPGERRSRVATARIPAWTFRPTCTASAGRRAPLRARSRGPIPRTKNRALRGDRAARSSATRNACSRRTRATWRPRAGRSSTSAMIDRLTLTAEESSRRWPTACGRSRRCPIRSAR